MNKKSILMLIMVLVVISLQSQTIEVTIEDILANPGIYVGRVVTVEGRVEQWVESPIGTSYYVLKGRVLQNRVLGVENKSVELIGMTERVLKDEKS